MFVESTAKAPRAQMTDNERVVRLFIQGIIDRDVSCDGIEPGPAIDPSNQRMVTLSEGGTIKWCIATRRDILRWIEEGWVFDEETIDWAQESQDDEPRDK